MLTHCNVSPLRKLNELAKVCALMMLAFTSLPSQAFQDNAKSQDDCQLISSQKAIKQAEENTKGKVVSIKLEKAGKNSVYKVRVLVDEKRVKNLSIKACK